ncbi:MAG: LysM peptidoglycan-binding domain-containing protein [Elusimicrobia bacterium]|nr:LysM peptidoglycan-binding domain-containing protein [Elusimicrobiota bacterium]
MKLILLISVFVLFMGGVIYADVLKLAEDDTIKTDTVQNDVMSKEEIGIGVNKRHYVKDGDTLWDLAGKYYADPFKWRAIYNANTDIIKNPDLIYPENEIEIPGINEKIVPKLETIAEPKMIEKEEIVEFEEEEIIEAASHDLPEKIIEEASVKIEKPKKFKIPALSEEMPSDQMEWNSMLVTDLVDKKWSGDGIVLGKESKEEKDALSFSGDIINIKMKLLKGVSIGQILNVYKLGAKVHDDDGNFKGFKIQRVGIVEVIEANTNEVKCVVVQANSSIMKGQIVKK